MWVSRNEFRAAVLESWESDPSRDVIKKITNCSKALEAWNKESFGDIRHRIAETTRDCTTAFVNNLDSANQLQRDLNLLCNQEEIMWRQRSKAFWLRDGNRNTRFFHSVASNRRRRNEITGLKNAAGDWCSDATGIERILVDYFKEILTTSTLLW
ncbi:hypothetical protein CCACVL1_14716 [Corchorus capsularis]|uniref:Uncharacterized protein n=1 Tax=Corchorus capsularis TaxID=210143 RepID=A0A1R3I651_COCAP|nr:hypothetical protein CCACVL1_14716 [Corchorus capsularis]